MYKNINDNFWFYYCGSDSLDDASFPASLVRKLTNKPLLFFLSKNINLTEKICALMIL